MFFRSLISNPAPAQLASVAVGLVHRSGISSVQWQGMGSPFIMHNSFLAQFGFPLSFVGLDKRLPSFT